MQYSSICIHYSKYNTDPLPASIFEHLGKNKIHQWSHFSVPRFSHSAFIHIKRNKFFQMKLISTNSCNFNVVSRVICLENLATNLSLLWSWTLAASIIIAERDSLENFVGTASGFNHHLTRVPFFTIFPSISQNSLDSMHSGSKCR